MGSSYLIDTNAVIDLIGGQLPTSGELWLDNLIVTKDTYLSLINRIELLGFNGPKNEMAVLASFVSSVEVLPITDDIADKAIELRKIKKIKLPDALIAATAIVHQLTLISRNAKDFSGLPDLITIDPHTK